MVRAWLGAGIILMSLFGPCGCGKSEPVEAKLVKVGAGLEQAKVILNDYVKGVPMGSEQMTFDDIVADVRQTDPQKATILEKGFADLRRSPGNRSGKARELLKQL